MIKEFKCYTLLCDNCGVDVNEDSDSSGWDDEDYNYEIADEAGWVEDDDCQSWYCSDCCSYDDNDKLIIDKLRKDKYRKEENNG